MARSEHLHDVLAARDANGGQRRLACGDTVDLDRRAGRGDLDDQLADARSLLVADASRLLHLGRRQRAGRCEDAIERRDRIDGAAHRGLDERHVELDDGIGKERVGLLQLGQRGREVSFVEMPEPAIEAFRRLGAALVGLRERGRLGGEEQGEAGYPGALHR